jgi:hypothetical protein
MAKIRSELRKATINTIAKAHFSGSELSGIYRHKT